MAMFFCASAMFFCCSRRRGGLHQRCGLHLFSELGLFLRLDDCFFHPTCAICRCFDASNFSFSCTFSSPRATSALWAALVSSSGLLLRFDGTGA